MKAIVLAAGFSTRLYPLTENFPKGLLPLQDKPLISYLLDEVVKSTEIEEIALITNHICFPHYQEFVTKPPYQDILVLENWVVVEDKRLGAIGDLQFAIDQLGWKDDDLVVLPSDTLVSLSFHDFLQFSQQKNEFVNVVYDTGDKDVIKSRLGCATLSGDQITSFTEKPAEPESTITSVPIYYNPKQTLHLIKEYLTTGLNADSPGAIIPWLLEQTKCFGYLIKDGFYFDVGTTETYNELQTKDLTSLNTAQ